MPKVKDLHYHRNGVSGLGFYVGIVEEEDREMLVIRFPKEADTVTGNIVCAAFDLAQLDKREIRFFYNSWRGDHYSDTMDTAIAVKQQADDLRWEMEQAIRDLQSV
jgi:hypothetical protein